MPFSSTPSRCPSRRSALEELDLAGNRLERLPPSLFELAALCALDVSWNRLRSLGEIVRLRRLEDLRISENPIQHLPEDLGSLPLTFLEVDFEQAKLLPSALSRREGLCLQVL